MRGASALLLLVGCAAYDGEPVYDYSCQLVRSCGEGGHFTTLDVTGTVEEIREFAADWSAGCQALTSEDVAERRCEFVLCAALCWPILD